MSRREYNQTEKKSKLLPISIIIFAILSIVALFIILNKGKIFGYSLVKIETVDVSADETEGTMEISVEKKYLSSKDDEEAEISVLINGEKVDINDIELTTSNEDVIEIQDGIATAVSDGKTTITAKKDNLEAAVDLHVITPIKSMDLP